MSQGHQDSQAPSAERRSARRVPCNLQIGLRLDTFSLRVELMNISANGMFVRGPFDDPHSALVIATMLKPGKHLLLQAQVEGSTDVYEAIGRVARRSDMGVGVDFVEITPALATLVSRLIATNGSDPEPLATLAAATLQKLD